MDGLIIGPEPCILKISQWVFMNVVILHLKILFLHLIIKVYIGNLIEEVLIQIHFVSIVHFIIMIFKLWGFWIS